jgi:hypothetical protein
MLLCGILSEKSLASTQQQITPATHMWVRTGLNSVVYVPVRSVEQCIMLTQQAAYINSAESICFNANALVRRVNCQKSVKKDGAPSCT